MPETLLSYAQRFLAGGGADVKPPSPVLVWEAPPAEDLDDDEQMLTTAGHRLDRPRAGQALVFEIQKRGEKSNPFLDSITVGRTTNNDVLIDDHSVSRFHAYFKKDNQSGLWKLVDASSSNGTWVGPLKLRPGVAEMVRDLLMLRFGDVEVRFMLPESFTAMLRDLMTAPR
ncbi:MAG: FHA domain-containing protein [Myxococcales bacterium]|nr:FHA domain-containing protein [Myxococcales bacterium]